MRVSPVIFFRYPCRSDNTPLIGLVCLRKHCLSCLLQNIGIGISYHFFCHICITDCRLCCCGIPPQYCPGCSRYVPVDSVQHRERNVVSDICCSASPTTSIASVALFPSHLQYQYCSLPVYQCRCLLPSGYLSLLISYFCGHSVRLHED